MRGVLNVLAAERRRRWGSWLALALLVTLVGGTVLAGITAARRTESAFPAFVARYGADAAVFATGPLPSGLDHPRGLDVTRTDVLPAYLTGNVRIGQTFIPSADLTVYGLPDDHTGDAMRLLSGHLPTASDQVLVGFSLAAQARLQIGSVIRVPLYKPSQAQEVYASAGTPTPYGPVAVLHVVGFEAGILDFPTAAPSYTLAVGPSFADTIGRHVVVARIGFYRLSNGPAGVPQFNFDVNHLSTGHLFLFPFPLDSQISAVESSIHPQVIGWWLFALVAALAGLALVGQALARQSIVERESFPTLSALGCTPRQLFAVGMLRAGAIAIVGALASVVVAIAVSPLTPVGEARAADPTPGLSMDPLILGLGGLAIIVVVLALAAYPAWRWAQARAAAPGHDPVGRSSMVATAAARVGAPPPMLIGIRHALERGRGRASVPVATAILGTVAAVAALSATSVFGASLTHLLDTPPLYGQGWTVDLGGFNSTQAHAVSSAAARLPGVERVTFGVSNKEITVNGTPTNVMLLQSAKGRIALSLVEGHYPANPTQLALGTQTLAAAHAQVGSAVTVSIIGPNGHTSTGRLHVVGTTVFPPVVNNGGGLGDGAMAPLSAAYELFCKTTAPSSPCVRKLTATIASPGFTNWGMGIETAPTPAGRRSKALLEQRYALHLDVITVPTNLVNFGQAVNFPVLLGGLLAVLGAATLVHLLLVSVARRRRELALLKVLGFLRRQAAASVCWQSATIAVVGLIVGIPLGIAVGHLVWAGFANDVGAVPVAVVPATLLVVLAAAVLACGVAFAVLPAALASRLHPAEALREQ